MRYWSVTLASVVVAAVLLSPLPVSAQSETEPAPRTAWGQPDLGGVWEYKTRTPLERPERFGEREFLTEEEAAEIAERERARIQAMEERPAQRTVAIPTAGRPSRPVARLTGSSQSRGADRLVQHLLVRLGDDRRQHPADVAHRRPAQRPGCPR